MTRSQIVALFALAFLACHASEPATSPSNGLASARATEPAVEHAPAAPSSLAGSHAERFDAFRAEYEAAALAFAQRQGFEITDPDDARSELSDSFPGAAEFQARLQSLFDEDPSDSTAFAIVRWAHWQLRPRVIDHASAYAAIARYHVEREGILELTDELDLWIDPAVEPLLATLLEKSSRADVRAHALYQLAHGHVAQARILRRRLEPHDEDDAVMLREFLGARAADALFAADLETVERKAVAELERLAREHADVVADPDFDEEETFGELAERDLFELQRLRIGETAPEIEGVDLDGKPLKLGDLRGKVVLLEFWSVDDPELENSLAQYGALLARFKDAPFAIVGVVGCDEPERVEEAVAAHGVTWRSFFDGEAESGSIARRWNVEHWPTRYFIDAEGILRHRDVRGDAQLAAVIDELVARARTSSAAQPK